MVSLCKERWQTWGESVYCMSVIEGRKTKLEAANRSALPSDVVLNAEPLELERTSLIVWNCNIHDPCHTDTVLPLKTGRHKHLVYVETRFARVRLLSLRAALLRP